MRRALLSAAVVIALSFIATIALSIWITWEVVLPDFAGPSTFISPGLKFPLAEVKAALADVPDRDPARLATRLGIAVTPLDERARAAFFVDPSLVVPLERGETFYLHVDDDAEMSEGVLTTADGRALRLAPLTGLTPFQPETLTLWLASVLLPAVAASALILLPLARRLRALEATARRLSAGELDARAPELGATRELASALNTMAERTERLIASHEELLQAVSHELRTPAARVRFALELLAAAPDDPTRSRHLAAIDRDLGELDALVSELLSFSRLGAAPRVERVPTALAGVVAAFASPRTRVVPGPDVSLAVDPRELGRALGNLVANAERAARARVEIGWRVDPATTPPMIEIWVDDDGPGVDPAERERIFAPFVVGDASRGKASAGVGLGLAIVRRIVERHGGDVRVASSPLGGARFLSRWPADGDPRRPGPIS